MISIFCKVWDGCGWALQTESNEAIAVIVANAAMKFKVCCMIFRRDLVLLLIAKKIAQIFTTGAACEFDIAHARDLPEGTPCLPRARFGIRAEKFLAAGGANVGAVRRVLAIAG